MMGLGLKYSIPADGVTAFESEIWEEMDTNPEKFEAQLRDLVHAAMDHMKTVGSRGIIIAVHYSKSKLLGHVQNSE